MDEKLHRIHVNIDKADYAEFKETIQWGLRNTLIVSIIRLITKAVQEEGMMVVGAVLSNKYKLVIDREGESSATFRGSETRPSLNDHGRVESQD